MNLSDLLNKAETKLKYIHPFLAEIARELIKRAYDKGIYVIITQGLRTIDEQNELYAKGRTQAQLNAVGLSHVKAQPNQKKVTNAKGGTSYHNFSLAFDFAIANSTGTVVYWDTNIDTNKDKQKDWHQVGKLGQELGLEWGGAWTGLIDIPHFQYTFGLTLAQLRAGKKPPEVKIESVKEELTMSQYEELKKDIADLKKLILGEGNTPSQWSSEVWNRKVSEGYFDGTKPQGVITREQGAILIDRLVVNIDKYKIEPLKKEIEKIKSKL